MSRASCIAHRRKRKTSLSRKVYMSHYCNSMLFLPIIVYFPTLHLHTLCFPTLKFLTLLLSTLSFAILYFPTLLLELDLPSLFLPCSRILAHRHTHTHTTHTHTHRHTHTHTHTHTHSHTHSQALTRRSGARRSGARSAGESD
jgi:ABC-type nickel/cobalt efflux system permease component RcnA